MSPVKKRSGDGSVGQTGSKKQQSLFAGEMTDKERWERYQSMEATA
jgi:hypothetical protein